MAKNAELDAFLAEAATDAAASAPTPEPAQRADPPEPAPAAAKPEAALSTPTAPAKPEEDDDGPLPKPVEGEDIVPYRAYETERRKRQDWKEQAIRAQAERDEIRRQFEAAQQAAAQPKLEPTPAVPLFTPPPKSFEEDPQGYINALQYNFARATMIERLNNSEEMFRDKLGDEKADAYIAEFKQEAERDKTLYDKLYSQRSPHKWLAKEVDKWRTVKDLGDDPAAYRERMKAELRAEIEAEQQQRGNAQESKPAARSAPQMQPSLATARSVASRSDSTWTGEPSLEDILRPVQNRKNSNGITRQF